MSKLQSGTPPDPDATLRPGPDADRQDAAAMPFLAPPRQPDEIGRLGPYRIQRILGQGTMGIVFQGEDVALHRAVALKVMRPELSDRPDARERFLREAQAIAALQHDSIVSIFHVGDDQGVLYIVMPLLRGMSLEEYLRKGRTLTVNQVLRVGKDVARGLQAAHERGLIHRDVKPANLWIDAASGGRIKILDFGLSRPMQADRPLTQHDVFLGTPAYVAPEQINGNPEARSDLYSLGAVLYRLLAGRLPFPHTDPMELMLAVTTQQPPPLRMLAPQVPPALADLVMSLLAKKPEGRPASAAAVVERLRAVGRGDAEPDEALSGRLPAVDLSLAGAPSDATQQVRGPAARARPEEAVTAPKPMRPEETPSEQFRSMEPPTRRASPKRRRSQMEWASVAVLVAGLVLMVVALTVLLINFLPRRGAGTPPAANKDGEKEKDRDKGKEKEKPPDEGPRAGFVSLFDGKTLDGWDVKGMGPDLDRWEVRDGAIWARPGHRGMLQTQKKYGDFELDLQWRLPEAGELGVTVRQTSERPPRQNSHGAEVRLVDEPAFGKLEGTERCGALLHQLTPLEARYLGAGRWNHLRVRCEGARIVVTLNDAVVIDTKSQGELEGLPERGVIGLHGLMGGGEFRKVFVKELR